MCREKGNKIKYPGENEALRRIVVTHFLRDWLYVSREKITETKHVGRSELESKY